jgi:ABC-type sulfate/molybdate transport systems ATPase subunit
MIAIRQVTKLFGNIKAVDALTLEIPAGETLVIQGPSGSGKTTLLRLVAGLELPDQGEIHIAGEPVSAPSWCTPPFSRHIGFVFQRSALWPHMTTAQNISFAIRVKGKHEKTTLLNQLLDMAVLSDLADRYPSQLSGGEARRVALARALAAQPRRLLLDEPFTSLDLDLKTQLLRVIQAYTQEHNTTLLYVTHTADEAQHIGGRMVRMERGNLVEA